MANDWQYIRKTYKIKEQIGSGSYGTVVRVHDRKTKKVYAVKYLSNFIKSVNQSKMVLREL